MSSEFTDEKTDYVQFNKSINYLKKSCPWLVVKTSLQLGTYLTFKQQQTQTEYYFLLFLLAFWYSREAKTEKGKNPALHAPQGCTIGQDPTAVDKEISDFLKGLTEGGV